MRVPFVLLFGFNKGIQKQKVQKGTIQEPSWKQKQTLSPKPEKQWRPKPQTMTPRTCKSLTAYNPGTPKVQPQDPQSTL